MKRKLPLFAILLVILGALGLTGCGSETATTSKPEVVKIDYAYYNPLSLVLKNKGFLEEELAQDGVKVEWVFSQGSNKSLELLNSKSVDFGSTAGAAALIGKANGNPIQSVYVYSRPEWTALLTRPGSGIEQVSDLKGKRVAVTRGTDPHIFLLRALEQVGLSDKDIQLVVLQHQDGKNALAKGDVDAWAGLDPLMAQAELDQGAKLFYRNPDFNTFGVLNVREEFAKSNPAYVEKVLVAYEKARKWAIEHPAEYKALVQNDAQLNDAVAAKVLERTDLKWAIPNDTVKQAIAAAGDILLKNGIVNAGVDITKVVQDLINPEFAQKVVKE